MAELKKLGDGDSYYDKCFREWSNRGYDFYKFMDLARKVSELEDRIKSLEK